MALSPDEKFIYVNPDTNPGEYNSAHLFPVKYLRGLNNFITNDAAIYLYFRGPADGVSTRILISITSGKVKEFFTQFIDEINFGEKSVITLADRNISVDATTGGTDFQHVNAYIPAAILNDSAGLGYEDVNVGEDLDVGGDLTVNSGVSNIETRKFSITGNTDGTYIGDVVFFGSTTSMTTGALYHYKSDGTWELADADAVATCDGMLAIALGAASDDDGMLLRGMVTLDHDPGAVGDVLFASTTAGDITATAPSGNNDIVRIVGYCLNASNGQIWFNPDNTFVEVTA
jgi:hypothetical protein